MGHTQSTNHSLMSGLRCIALFWEVLDANVGSGFIGSFHGTSLAAFVIILTQNGVLLGGKFGVHHHLSEYRCMCDGRCAFG